MGFPKIIRTALIILILLLPSLIYSSLYTVGKGDALGVDVFKEKEFSGDFKIDQRGNLNYPVVGDIPVEGKTVEEIKGVLLKILSKDYLVDPKITVNVKEYNSKKVMVVGSVVKPGVYPLKEESKVLDIISLVGGITKEGSLRFVVLRKDNLEPPSVEKSPDNNKITVEAPVIIPTAPVEVQIIKPEVSSESAKFEKTDQGLPKTVDVAQELPKKIETASGLKEESKDENPIAKEEPPNYSNLKPIVVDYGKIIKGGDLSQNIEIMGGDIINVPKANEVFVSGSVKGAGIIKYEDGMGVLQAITLAGGPSQEASPGSTYILRVEDGKEQKIKVNYNRILKQKDKNIEVKPNDVIVVPESFF